MAQRNKKDKQPPGPPSKPIDLKVQLAGFGPMGALQVLDPVQRPYWAVVEFPRTSVSVKGTAQASFLSPGMYLRLHGVVADEKKGTLADDVTTVTVFTPRSENSLGIVPYETPEGEEADKAKAGELEFSGQLVSLKKGKFQLQAGNVVVSGKLAEELSVKLNLGDLTVVPLGTELHVRGQLFEPDRIVCDLVETTLAEPLGQPAKKKRTRPSSKGKKAEQE